jgi:hypothetical protein
MKGDDKFKSEDDVKKRWDSTHIVDFHCRDPIESLRTLGKKEERKREKEEKKKEKKAKKMVPDEQVGEFMLPFAKQLVRVTNDEKQGGRLFNETTLLWQKSSNKTLVQAVARKARESLTQTIEEMENDNEDIPRELFDMKTALQSWTKISNGFKFIAFKLLDEDFADKMNVTSAWDFPTKDGKILNFQTLIERRRNQDDLFDCESVAAFVPNPKFEDERAELLLLVHDEVKEGKPRERLAPYLRDFGMMSDEKSKQPLEDSECNVVFRQEVEEEFDKLYRKYFPRAHRFLESLIMDSVPKRNYFRRLQGYSMTASTDDRHTYVGFGTGSGGKTSHKNAMKLIMGKMFCEAELAVIFEAPKAAENAHSAHTMACKNKRYVSVSEPKRTDKYDGRKLRVSGGDKESQGSRQINQESGCLEYFAKFHSNTNWHNYWETDDCAGRDRIWTIVHLTRFRDQYNSERSHMMKTMRKYGEVQEMDADSEFAALFAQSGEVLNELFTMYAYSANECWLLQPVFQNKLPVPQIVIKDTNTYCMEHDIIGKFVLDCLSPVTREDEKKVRDYKEVVGSGFEEEEDDKKPEKKAELAEVYKRYREWCELRGCKPKGCDAFAASLSAKGYVIDENLVNCELRQVDRDKAFYPPTSKRKRALDDETV